MNRAELRRNERDAQKKTKTYTLTNSEIEKIKNDAATDAVNIILPLLLGLPVMVLHDKFGFGEVRLNRFIDQVQDLYDSYMKGLITLKDINDVLFNEAGVTLSFGK